uniref:Uncharacterized protein n=1 Tax=Strongyloides stercoralis TaxID=6248 RepID=A0A0K0ES43_STRER
MPNYYVSPNVSEGKLKEAFYMVLNYVTPTGTFEEKFQNLMNKFYDFEILRLRKVTINSNGIFFDDKLKIQKPYVFLYQIVCLAMDQVALARKNRETVGDAVKNLWKQINGEPEEIINEVDDVAMVDAEEELTNEELQLLENIERNMGF